MIFNKTDFDKDLVESFLESSLHELPKEAIITDGAPMYKDILEKNRCQTSNVHILHNKKIFPN